MTPDHLFREANEGILRSLAKINASQEGNNLKVFLQALIDKHDKQNRHLEGTALYRSQGAVQILQALHDSLIAARSKQK
ncbi:MAG: hypothetical protein H7842_02555 [Gammaproteobacteria bacterium SHHR-1]